MKYVCYDKDEATVQFLEKNYELLSTLIALNVHMYQLSTI